MGWRRLREYVRVGACRRWAAGGHAPLLIVAGAAGCERTAGRRATGWDRGCVRDSSRSQDGGAAHGGRCSSVILMDATSACVGVTRLDHYRRVRSPRTRRCVALAATMRNAVCCADCVIHSVTPVLSFSPSLLLCPSHPFSFCLCCAQKYVSIPLRSMIRECRRTAAWPSTARSTSAILAYARSRVHMYMCIVI